MNILVSNVGSTSLKFKLYSMEQETVLCESRAERVGSCTDAVFTYKNMRTGEALREENCRMESYSDGIRRFIDCLLAPGTGVLEDLSEIHAVAFKTVLAKGYYGVHELTEPVMQGMRDYLYAAPAHNRPYLEAIRLFREAAPRARLIGVFETAFHTGIPRERSTYGIPYEWIEKYDIHRMGYHGASHSYIAQTLERRFGTTGKTISCHLGGSCSLCAIRDGKSIDTSFGFSLQTGILHASRSGDTDPYIIPFLLNEGLSMEEILKGLSEQGGLLGLSGVSKDLRAVEAAADRGNERAKLAIDVFTDSIIRYIGAFYAVLGGLDNLVFTGGIGEHDARIRSRICENLKHMGIWLDAAKNSEEPGDDAILSSENSPVRIHVIPANEEIVVARSAAEYLKHFLPAGTEQIL